MNKQTLVYSLLLALLVACKGGGDGGGLSESVSKSVTPHTDLQSTPSHLDQWFYLGFEFPAEKLIVIRAKITSDDFFILEQHSLAKSNLYSSVYQRTKSKLTSLGNKWQANDVVKTCGELSQDTLGIEASAGRLTLEDGEGIKLTFRAETSFYRSLFEQIVVEQMESCWMIMSAQAARGDTSIDLLPQHSKLK